MSIHDDIEITYKNKKESARLHGNHVQLVEQRGDVYFSLFISFFIIALLSFLLPLIFYSRISLPLAFATAFFSLLFNFIFALLFLKGAQKLQIKNLSKLFMGQSLLAFFIFARFPYITPLLLFFYIPSALLFFLLIAKPQNQFFKKATLIFLWFFLLFANFQITTFFFVTSLDFITYQKNPYHNFEVARSAQREIELRGSDGFVWKVKPPLSAQEFNFFSYLFAFDLSKNFRERIAPQLLISRPKLTLSYFDENNIGYAGVISYKEENRQGMEFTLATLQQTLVWKQSLFWSQVDEGQKIKSGILPNSTFENLKNKNIKIFWQQIPMVNILQNKNFSLGILLFEAQESSYIRFWIFDLNHDSNFELLANTIISGLEKN